MRRSTTPIIVLLALVALVPACKRGEETSQQTPTSSGAQPRIGGSVVMGVGGESTGWSPQADRWGPGPITVARAIFDPLVITGADTKVHPWLAESFTPQDNNKTWLIKVRKGIKFHNGETVDAHAVVYNLVTYQKSALTAFAFKTVRDIVKDDDYTVRVTLDQEWSNFPALFTGQAGFIAAPKQLLDADNRRPIGSGPFVFEKWTPDNELSVTKNPDYWRSDPAGRKLPYLDKVTFKPIPDDSNRAAALAAGDIDLLHTQTGSVVSRLLKGDMPAGFKVIEDTSEGDELCVVLNTQSGIMADESLRKALQLATDRKRITGLYDDQFEMADGPFTKDSPWWSDSGWPAPDTEKAKSLLDAWKGAHPGQPAKILLATVAAGDGLLVAQALQGMWNEVGFEVSIDSQEETKFSGTLLNGQFDALVFQFWNGADPDVNYHFWTGSNIGDAGGISLNFPRWTNAEFDAALNKGRAETDPAARKAQYEIVWKQWAEHVPYIFLQHSTWILETRPSVHGIEEVNLPDGTGNAEPLTWGTVTLSNTWTDLK